MQAITEYCGLPVNWKIPRLKTGDEIRFWYWDSKFKTFRGKRGVVIGIRHLSARPLDPKSKAVNKITRGSVSYLLKIKKDRYVNDYYYINSFYNQRMSNVEIIY